MTVPILNLCQLIVGLAFGWIVFSERPEDSGLRIVLQLSGLVMISIGVIRLGENAETGPGSPVGHSRLPAGRAAHR